MFFPKCKCTFYDAWQYIKLIMIHYKYNQQLTLRLRSEWKGKHRKTKLFKNTKSLVQLCLKWNICNKSNRNKIIFLTEKNNNTCSHGDLLCCFSWLHVIWIKNIEMWYECQWDNYPPETEWHRYWPRLYRLLWKIIKGRL